MPSSPLLPKKQTISRGLPTSTTASHRTRADASMNTERSTGSNLQAGPRQAPSASRRETSYDTPRMFLRTTPCQHGARTSHSVSRFPGTRTIDCFSCTIDFLTCTIDCLSRTTDCLTCSNHCFSRTNDCLTCATHCFSRANDCLSSTNDCLTCANHCFSRANDCLTCATDCLTLQRRPATDGDDATIPKPTTTSPITAASGSSPTCGKPRSDRNPQPHPPLAQNAPAYTEQADRTIRRLRAPTVRHDRGPPTAWQDIRAPRHPRS